MYTFLMIFIVFLWCAAIWRNSKYTNNYRLIVCVEAVAVDGKNGDVIDELTSKVRLELSQPRGGVAHLLLQAVPTVAQRVDTLRLVMTHDHLQLVQKTVWLLQHEYDPLHEDKWL